MTLLFESKSNALTSVYTLLIFSWFFAKFINTDNNFKLVNSREVSLFYYFYYYYKNNNPFPYL